MRWRISEDQVRINQLSDPGTPRLRDGVLHQGTGLEVVDGHLLALPFPIEEDDLGVRRGALQLTPSGQHAFLVCRGMGGCKRWTNSDLQEGSCDET
jgi:hypothetical protein